MSRTYRRRNRHGLADSPSHNMFCVAFDGKLYHAPLDSPQKVLDVGTGTGIWAM